MSCLVKLYESVTGHPTLTAASVELLAVDQASRANCCAVQTNSHLASGGYGANLPFAVASIVYEIAIVDTAQVYAGATVQNLNGSINGDIDVVLFKLPPGGAGPVAATTGVQMRTNILTYGMWSSEERQGVLSVINALASLRGTTVGPVLGFIDSYERVLRARAIDPRLF
jgi:hypothetical protein